MTKKWKCASIWPSQASTRTADEVSSPKTTATERARRPGACRVPATPASAIGTTEPKAVAGP